MMIELINFKAEHLNMLVEQEATAYLKPYITADHAKELEKHSMAYTGLSQGRVVVCAGVVEYWPGRGGAWAILDRICKKEFLGIHNAVKRFLETCPIKRVEAEVDVEFEAGHRWARLLGFELEAPRLKAYRPNGGDCALYAKVRG